MKKYSKTRTQDERKKYGDLYAKVFFDTTYFLLMQSNKKEKQ